MSANTDPGRAAEEMRPDLLDDLDRANTLREPQRCSDLMDEARLVIIAIQADLIAARKERDEARGYANRNGNAARYWEWIHAEKDKRLARAEAEAAQLRARLHEAEKGAEAMRDALDQAEACLSIVAPRSDKAEYLRTLGVVRAALAAKSAPPLNRSETDGGRHGPEA
ncbi:hypothetical protein [Methylobacterium sp.]|uniref:hypothetical protein n=1 Tax=Methylobacterium sp. TaxID=409 RepID=UPI00257F38DD|nr:hypothetical protein [Methylobacterium sp.]